MIISVSMITYFCLTYRMKVAEYNPEKGITISIDLNSEKLQWYVCKSLVCEHESNFLKFLHLNIHIILSSVITARKEVKLVRMNLKKIGTYANHWYVSMKASAL